MKIFTKIRDLLVYELWFQVFLAYVLNGFLYVVFNDMENHLNGLLRIYVVLGIVCLLIFIAGKFKDVEYAGKVKVYFPKKNTEGLLAKLQKKKWTHIEVGSILLFVIGFGIPISGSASSEIQWLTLLLLAIFLILLIFLISADSEAEENKLARLIVTKTKVIIYKGLKNTEKWECDLNYLMARLESGNQLSLIPIGEEESDESIIIEESYFHKKDWEEILNLFLLK